MKGVIFIKAKTKTYVLVTVFLIAVFSFSFYVLRDTAGIPAPEEPVIPPPESGIADTPDELNTVQYPSDPAGGQSPVTPPGNPTQESTDADGEGGASATPGEEPEDQEEPEEVPDAPVTVTISAVGDITLGGDPRGSNNFIREFEHNDGDYGYFLRNVRYIFEEDDLTVANLEGALTDATSHAEKTYVMRGPPHFTAILSSSGVEAVTLANNHSKDFFERGYTETIESLEASGVMYFGNESNTILEINGIRVGLFGYLLWYGGRSQERLISASIGDLKERGAQLIIAYYHWGTELNNIPDSYQRALGRFSIDSGADLVLGAHPHVLQGIEEYNGRYIVYSLANFCFGGNNNPQDQDTFIFQQTFTFEEGVLLDVNEINIIPAFVSSERGRNNFQPTVAEGDDAERILERIRNYSERL